METTSHPCFSQNYHSSLHSTRKQPTKPWKKPVTASLQRMRPRVYRVEPINFKELVQRLTGPEEEHEPEVIHQVESKPLKLSDGISANNENPYAYDLSPSSNLFWEAFPLLSPANLSRW